MFIRKTFIRNPDKKSQYINFQLVESVRTERGPRQRILLNLGTQLDLNAQQLRQLANRIEEIVQSQATCLPLEDAIETLAQNYASRLVKNLAQPLLPSKETAAAPDYATIDLNTIEHQEARTVGAEDLLLQTAKQLELPETLATLGLSQKQVAIALSTIIARAAFPASERETHARLVHHSGLGELLNVNFSSISLNQFYEISDQLLSNKRALEQSIAERQKRIHHCMDTIVLYDLTNTYFEGRARGNPKAQFGVSKEKRKDCPLVTLGLVLNQEGFLHRSELLPGNVSEPASLKNAIEALAASEDLFKPTIVMDAGIATEENLLWLKENGYGYIVVARGKAPSEEIPEEWAAVGQATQQVKVAEITVQNEEKWVYCESPAKEATASAMKNLFQKRLEQDLEKMAAGLHKPKGRRRLHKVLERIGRLREKHRAIAHCYKIEAIPSEDGLTAIRIEWNALTEKLEDKLKGRYYLRSNLLHFSAKELWGLYNCIRIVEDAFRLMKSSLGMRPIYHQKERRVDGHLWITILAYTLIQDILYRLRSQGITYNWNTLRTKLSTRVRVTTQAKTDAGKALHFRSTTQAEPLHKQIYHALGLSDKILRATKMAR